MGDAEFAGFIQHEYAASATLDASAGESWSVMWYIKV